MDIKKSETQFQVHSQVFIWRRWPRDWNIKLYHMQEIYRERCHLHNYWRQFIKELVAIICASKFMGIISSRQWGRRKIVDVGVGQEFFRFLSTTTRCVYFFYFCNIDKKRVFFCVRHKHGNEAGKVVFIWQLKQHSSAK